MSPTIPLHDVDENLPMAAICPVCGERAFTTQYHPNVARAVARQNNPPLTLYQVRVYPYRGDEPAALFFTREADAEQYAREVMRLPKAQADYLAGGEAPVVVHAVETLTLFEARALLARWLKEEWGER